MKIVQGDELPLQRGLEHRGGMFHFRNLMEGVAGRLDNFQISYGEMGGDFYSPRHRHNFEQIRFQMEGELDYSKDGKLSKGMIGYFPEGMHYGPQVPSPDAQSVTIVLQCGGASGGGYLSRTEVKSGREELKKFGTFEGGVYHRNDDVPGKRNLDGYQAIWEQANNRPMDYPKARYAHPILMDPKNYQWVPISGSPGAYEKYLGVFSESRTEIRTLKLDAGASHKVEGRGVYFVVGGIGKIEDQELRSLTTLHLEQGETATVIATKETEIVHFGLPNLTHLMADDGCLTSAPMESLKTVTKPQ